MWPVTCPHFDVETTFDLSISNIKDKDLKDRLQKVRTSVVTSEADFHKRATDKQLNTFPRTNNVLNTVSNAEMVALYDQKLAHPRGPARKVYEHIKLLPAEDRCPFCNQRGVNTVDHVLPKQHYSSVTVTPFNLVGCCMECNRIKHNNFPNSAEEVILHPYYDNISSNVWLVASIVHSTPCSVVFSISPPTVWDAVTTERAQRTFKMLNLAQLYTKEAARELANIRYNLDLILQAGGATAVQSELYRHWMSRSQNEMNSWQTATYLAFASDPWFYSGGFICP